MSSDEDLDRDEFTLGSAFEFARDLIKSLILVNGGAVIALLTFHGTFLDKAGDASISSCAQLSAFGGILSFALGVLFAVLCGIFSYLTQLQWGVTADNGEQRASKAASALWYHKIVLVMALISVLSFVLGVVLTAMSLFLV